MSKKVRRLLIACVCAGLLAGFIEYSGLLPRVGSRFTVPEPIIASALAPAVAAESAILIDGDDGRVIYEKNADKELYPASTTKIMTALVVFGILEETGTNLDSVVVVPGEAANIEGSTIYLKAGEKVTIRELMYGMMLQSGNDAAAALAICCGGSMDGFEEDEQRGR